MNRLELAEQLTEIMVRRSKNEALQAAEAARTRADADGDVEGAAFLSNWMGSALVASGRDDDALTEYLRAERYDPKNPGYKLTTAWHLLFAKGRAEDARTRAQEALRILRPDDPLIYKANILVGHTYFTTGDAAGLDGLFDALISDVRRLDVPSRDLDLSLAAAVIEASATSAGCKKYLLEVIERAARAGDSDKESQARELYDAGASQTPPTG